MNTVLPVEKIEETETFKVLKSRNDKTRMNFLKNLAVRKVITHGFIVYKNTGEIPTNVTGINLSVVNDLIEMDKNEK